MRALPRNHARLAPESCAPWTGIRTDRVIDFNANYTFTDAADNYVGSIKRRGARSFWKAHYEVYNGSEIAFTITAANPWTKVMDGFLREIPIVGIFAGYFFHRAYNVARPGGEPVMRLQKKSAFLEGRFEIANLGELTVVEEVRTLLATIITALLERPRG